MIRLDATLTYLEDRITYYNNIVKFVMEEKSKGKDVHVEGTFGNKVEDWIRGHIYAKELASSFCTDRDSKLTFIKTIIYEDIKTMWSLLKFNVDEKELQPSTTELETQIRDTKKHIAFLEQCLNEIKKVS